jgi:hypothetical protein
MSQLWSITAVRPLKNRERVHTTVHLVALGDTADEALARVKEHDDGRSCWFSKPSPCGPVQTTVYGTWTPAQLAQARGEPLPEAKPKKEPKLSTRPLGAAQRGVLEALKRNGGKWPAGWVWDTESGTCRVLEGLAQRCLVDRVDRGPNVWPLFTINANGLAELEKGNA